MLLADQDKIHLALGLHNHQPIGNWDRVIEDAYQHSYLPFIDVLERHPAIRLSIHYAGHLLTWLEERHPELLSEAMERKVVIVTPTTLFALCKAVAYGWRAEDQAKGAAKVAELGRELYKRIAVMGDHVSGLGKAIEAAVSRYNAFVGSLETQVMSQAKRFEELATHHEGKAIPELKPVESGVRPTAKLAALARDEDPQPEALNYLQM